MSDTKRAEAWAEFLKVHRPQFRGEVAFNAAWSAATAAEREQWKQTLDDIAVCNWTYDPSHTPAEAILSLVRAAEQIALDPKVSAEARALVAAQREADAKIADNNFCGVIIAAAIRSQEAS